MFDLRRFTQEKEKKGKDEIILDNKDIKIIKNNNDIEFTIKNKKALEKYQDFFFFGATNSIITGDVTDAEKFFKKSLQRGTEGLMFKSLDSYYKPGIRTGSMAKLKETKEDLDVVIMGAEHGKGKRAGFYSSFIVGVKNDDYSDADDMFLEIGKVSSGILELGSEGHTMENLTNLLKPFKIEEKNGFIKIEPKIVLQVRYQEIQKSTIYRSGYALRFPRIISLREDKDTQEINSIADIFHLVEINKSS